MMPAAPPLCLLWIDPGLLTGMAWLYRSTGFDAGQWAWDDACIRLEVACASAGPVLHIGYEKFTILPSTHKLSPQPEAYEFPGVIRFLARRYGCVLLEPAQPADRLAVTPAELKAIGWWPAGLDDAQSAAQHLLAWLKREKCVPPDLARKLGEARS
jgi:hypothetical protein